MLARFTIARPVPFDTAAFYVSEALRQAGFEGATVTDGFGFDPINGSVEPVVTVEVAAAYEFAEPSKEDPLGETVTRNPWFLLRAAMTELMRRWNQEMIYVTVLDGDQPGAYLYSEGETGSGLKSDGLAGFMDQIN